MWLLGGSGAAHAGHLALLIAREPRPAARLRCGGPCWQGVARGVQRGLQQQESRCLRKVVQVKKAWTPLGLEN